MEPLRLGFFTEIYRPVVNGVVASVEALADGLRARGHRGILLRAAHARLRRSRRSRLPDAVASAAQHALPADAAAREPAQSQHRDQAALTRTRALAVRHRLDGSAIRAPLRHAAGLHVSHAARSVRALRSVRTERHAFCRRAADAHVRQYGRRRRRADAGHGDTAARARRQSSHRSRSERNRPRAFRLGPARRGAAFANRYRPGRSDDSLRRPLGEGEERRAAPRGAGPRERRLAQARHRRRRPLPRRTGAPLCRGGRSIGRCASWA